MAPFISANGIKARGLVKEFSIGRMGQYTKVIGKMMQLAGREDLFTLMGMPMFKIIMKNFSAEIGLTIEPKAKGSTIMWTVLAMKGIGRTISKFSL
jgi:hypothetical protein